MNTESIINSTLPPEMMREIMSNLDETKKLKAENKKLVEQTEILWDLFAQTDGTIVITGHLIDLYGEEHVKKIFDKQYAMYKEEEEEEEDDRKKN